MLITIFNWLHKHHLNSLAQHSAFVVYGIFFYLLRFSGDKCLKISFCCRQHDIEKADKCVERHNIRSKYKIFVIWRHVRNGWTLFSELYIDIFKTELFISFWIFVFICHQNDSVTMIRREWENNLNDFCCHFS